jgi:hypothetical protein
LKDEKISGERKNAGDEPDGSETKKPPGGRL